jgi:hypothetical protein
MADIKQIGKEKFVVPDSCREYVDKNTPDIFGCKIVKRLGVKHFDIMKNRILDLRGPELVFVAANGKKYRMLNPFILEPGSHKKRYHSRENLIRLYFLFQYFEVVELKDKDKSRSTLVVSGLGTEDTSLVLHKPFYRRPNTYSQDADRKLWLLIKMFEPVELK